MLENVICVHLTTVCIFLIIYYFLHRCTCGSPLLLIWVSSRQAMMNCTRAAALPRVDISDYRVLCNKTSLVL